MAMDATNRKLLEQLQRSFPLVAMPFRELEQSLGLERGEALRRVAALKEAAIIREIGGIFDSRALGYQTTLVALSVPSERLEPAAAVISQHPGVSHNYAREHYYNLWFTIALPPEQDMDRASQEMACQVGAQEVLSLPALRVFKIGAFFHLSDQEEAIVEAGPDGHLPPPFPLHLTAQEIALIRELQQDLPLEEQPFGGMAQRLGISQAQLLQMAQGFLDQGLMRRFAALLHHRHLGFVANGMTCWRVPLERLEEVGQGLAAFPGVTHCYQRATYPHWPYNLYTMIHASTQEECLAKIRLMSQRVGISDYIVLFSTREFKKARVKYFC